MLNKECQNSDTTLVSLFKLPCGNIWWGMWGISEGVFRQATSLHVRRLMTSSVLPYLYDYIKQTRERVFFLLKKKSLQWMSDISLWKASPPCSEQLGSEMTAHALTMYGLRRREVNEHASTDDPWLGDGKIGRVSLSLKGSGVWGYHLPPKCCHCAVLSLTGQTPRVTFTHTGHSSPRKKRRSRRCSRVQTFTLSGNLDQPAIAALKKQH